MKLFTINQENEVDINLPWIKLIPEFDALFTYKQSGKRAFTRDTKAKKLIAYIYFTLDFSSPLRVWEDEAKEKEALNYTGLEANDVHTAEMKAALLLYTKLQYEACRPLKTYRSALKSLDAMDDYFNTVNFSDKDKMGKLLYTPNQLTANLTTINKAYDELSKLEKRVEEELTQSTGIRGKAILGDREIKAVRGDTKQWEEGMSPQETTNNWKEMGTLLHQNTEEDA